LHLLHDFRTNNKENDIENIAFQLVFFEKIYLYEPLNSEPD
jgi:hypothetical protein